MCNSVSDLYSLYNDSKELLKGNWTKTPEVLLETNLVLNALAKTNGKLGQKVKSGFDTFIKNGLAKSDKLTHVNLDAVALVAGLTNCFINDKKNPPKNKFLSKVPFLTSWAAKCAIEGVMNTKTGSNVLQKTAGKVSDVIAKPLSSVLGKNAEAISKIGTYIISGIAFQFISDKFTEKVETLTQKYIDKRENNKV